MAEPEFGSAGVTSNGALHPLGGGGEDFFEEEPLHHEHEEPPPPYESIIIDPPPSQGVTGTSRPQEGSGVYGAPLNPEFTITVSDPVKQGEGVGAYVSYKVSSRTSLPQYRAERSEVIRRFRDFTWLAHALRAAYPGTILPALPEKNVVEKYKLGSEFIEARRAALAIFLNRLAAHPTLRTSHELQLFLEASETEFGIEVSRSQMEGGPLAATAGGPTRKTLTGAVQFFKELGHSASNLYHKRTEDEEEDPEYLKVRAYMSELERHLAEAHRQAARLVRHQAELGSAIQEFGAAMSSLGRFEETVSVSDTFTELGNKAESVSRLCQHNSDTLARSFEAPFKEFARMVKTARKTMADRSAALAAYHQARGEVDARRGRLAKLRGTPGIREDRMSEAERDLHDAQRRAEEAKAAYEGIVRRMGGELGRFQRERAEELQYVLRDFAVCEAQLSSDSAKVWQSLVPGLAAVGGAG